MWLTGTLSEPIPLIRVRSEDDGYEVSTHANLAWLVSDCWLAQASVEQQREIRKTNGFTVRDGWQWIMGAGLTYFVEDRLALQLSAIEQRLDQSSSGYFTRYGTFSLGVTYRLLGDFRAPGILEYTR